MPNWVFNRLQLLGPPAAVDDLLARVDGETSFDFERIRPTPPELRSGDRVDDRTGLPEWRMWRTEHWGCKWNASDVELERGPDGSAAVKFLTPYGSPLPLLEQLAVEHPDVELVLEAIEEMGNFSGRIRWQRGRVVEDSPLDPEDVDWLELVDEDDD